MTDRFELEKQLNERSSRAVELVWDDPRSAYAQAVAEDVARDIAAAFDGIYVDHHVDEDGVLQLDAVQRMQAPSSWPTETLISITPWTGDEDDDVEDHPVVCPNCGATASGYVNRGTDYIHRIVCPSCGYKEDR